MAEEKIDISQYVCFGSVVEEGVSMGCLWEPIPTLERISKVYDHPGSELSLHPQSECLSGKIRLIT